MRDNLSYAKTLYRRYSRLTYATYTSRCPRYKDKCATIAFNVHERLREYVGKLDLDDWQDLMKYMGVGFV